MTKKIIISLIFIIILIVLIALVILGWYFYRSDRDNGDDQNPGSSDLVEYDPVLHGSTCPLGVKFEAGYDTSSVDCQCPAGYQKQSDIVAYELCYQGSECPVLQVECLKE